MNHKTEETMRKFFYLATIVAMSVLLASCGNKSDAKSNEEPESEQRAEAVRQQNDAKAIADAADDENNATVDEKTTKRDGGSTFEIERFLKGWQQKPLTLPAGTREPNIKVLMKAFCSKYDSYEPCQQMLLWLNDPAAFKKEQGRRERSHEIGYSVNDMTRNGYLNCSEEAQCEYGVSGCYWKRKDGHRLLCVKMEENYESEGLTRLLFYDYDPATNTLKPDVEQSAHVEQALSRYCPNFGINSLPIEDKDIQIVTWENPDDEDSEPIYYKLRWDGQRLKFDNKPVKY